MTVAQPVSFGRRISDLADAAPDRTALVFSPSEGPDRVFCWADVERRSLQIAALLQRRGAGQGSTVVVGLPNSPEHVFAAIAAWKLGACVLPLRYDLPAWERARLLEVAVQRMRSPVEGEPSKPDDLSFVLYRPKT